MAMTVYINCALFYLETKATHFAEFQLTIGNNNNNNNNNDTTKSYIACLT